MAFFLNPVNLYSTRDTWNTVRLAHFRHVYLLNTESSTPCNPQLIHLPYKHLNHGIKVPLHSRNLKSWDFVLFYKIYFSFYNWFSVLYLECSLLINLKRVSLFRKHALLTILNYDLIEKKLFNMLNKHQTHVSIKAIIKLCETFNLII